MGFFDSTSKTENTNIDNRAAADGGSLVATGESNLTVTNNTQSKAALETAAATFSEALDLADASSRRSDGIARLALGQASDASESDIKELAETFLPLLVVGFVAWKVFGK